MIPTQVLPNLHIGGLLYESPMFLKKAPRDLIYGSQLKNNEKTYRLLRLKHFH